MEKNGTNNRWQYRAKCQDAGVYPEVIAQGVHFKAGENNTELFFPPRDKDQYTPIADAAKALCYGRDGLGECPVRRECLIAALATDREQPHGILGGKSHRERAAMLRRHQATHPELTIEEYIYSDHCK